MPPKRKRSEQVRAHGERGALALRSREASGWLHFLPAHRRRGAQAAADSDNDVQLSGGEVLLTWETAAAVAEVRSLAPARRAPTSPSAPGSF